MPCMPATNTKSPALTPRLQVPSALMAPGGLSVLTPFGDGDCAKPGLDAMTSAATQESASRCNISISLLQQLLCDHPTRRSRTKVRWMRRNRLAQSAKPSSHDSLSQGRYPAKTSEMARDLSCRDPSGGP